MELAFEILFDRSRPTFSGNVRSLHETKGSLNALNVTNLDV